MPEGLDPLKQELFSYWENNPDATELELRATGFGQHLNTLYRRRFGEALTDFHFHRFVTSTGRYLTEQSPQVRKKLERALVISALYLKLSPDEVVIRTIFGEKGIAPTEYDEVLEAVGMYIVENPPSYTRDYRVRFEAMLKTREPSPQAASLEASQEVYALEDPEPIAPFLGPQLLKEQFEETLSILDDKERRVLQLRFGLEDGRRRSLREVGEAIGRSKSTAKRIEAQALAKLRHPSRARRIRDFLE